jgi:serine/threonine protein kinase
MTAVDLPSAFDAPYWRKRMPAPVACPELERWQALFGGAVGPEQWPDYERHLESCPACQDRLEQAEGSGHPLLAVVRQIGDPATLPLDPTLICVLGKLHEMKCPDSGSPVQPADLHFLRPSERSDILGTLGHYEVQEVIGQGGMGVVLKAFEPALHRLVAIKVMAPVLAGSVTARQRFTREAKAAAAVCHDHIVAVHSVNEADGLPYLVMQYVAGESLQARLDHSGPLELREIVRIGLQTASGLAAAHAQGLIHRDIKPANLLLENGLARVKITDFGLARMTDDVGVTQNGVVAGTPEYMAPEQACCAQIDCRADLFSLGSVLYGMCTGVPPFRGSTALAVLRQVSEAEPIPIRSLNPEIPEWLEKLVRRLMAKNPADRFQSAAEAAALLEGYLAHLQQPTTVTAPLLPPLPPLDRQAGLRRQTPRIVLSAGVLVLLIVVLLIVAALGRLMLAPGERGGDKDAKANNLPQYYHSFKDHHDLGHDFHLDGLDPEQCVHFEPAGLGISLPAGHAGRRMGTGVAAKFAVKGDFEITMSFEIVKEPDRAAAGRGTGLYLWIDLKTPDLNRAILTRAIFGWSGRQYMTWLRQANEAGKPATEDLKYFPAAAKSGQLRLVRTGAMLAHYVAEGADGAFTLLWQHPFGAEDVRAIRVGGHTGGPKASLDFRVTDLRVRADSLPDLPVDEVEDSGETAWLPVAFALSLTVALCLAVWLYLRQRRRRPPANSAATKMATAPGRISFACPDCGKRLKARAAMAGKQVKCPACAKAVFVPVITPAASASRLD